LPQIAKYDLDAREVRECGPDVELAGPEAGRSFYWFDVDRREGQAMEDLGERLGLSEEDQRHMMLDQPGPGLVEREGSVTVTLESWCNLAGEGKPVLVTLHLDKRFCLTLSAGDSRALRELHRIHEREFRYAQSPGFLLFLLVDHLVEETARALGPLDEDIEKLGERIYAEFDDDIPRDILRLKRKLLAIKRTITQVRDALMPLSARHMSVITEAGREALGEVFNHAQAIVASLDSQRELVGSLLDSYMSVQGQRLNESMKVLTIFASIVLPMTLIAGIYGMNFSDMPAQDHDWGYHLVLALMAGSGVGIFLFFRRRGWV